MQERDEARFRRNRCDFGAISLCAPFLEIKDKVAGERGVGSFDWAMMRPKTIKRRAYYEIRIQKQNEL
jgi:hypothetical protein